MIKSFRERDISKRFLLVSLCLGILLFIGTSYAIWQLALTQTDKNTVTTSCFKLDFQEENDIRLENAYPITDEEGKVLTPYTFTITSLCESNAKYQINLEVLNDTTLEDVSILKVMLDDKINLLTDKIVVSPTLANAKTSYLLKTGYLRNGESKTFSLRLWMDYDTPPNLEYMNKIFLSKITITAGYLDNLENTIASNVTSLNTGYDKNETFSIHLTSEKYNIVSVSDDGSSFEDLEEQGKDVTLEKIINTNGTHTLFVKDEAGNTSEVNIEATKIDDQKPVAKMNVTKNNNEIIVDASTSSDQKSEIAKYYFSTDNESFIESENASYTFTNHYQYGKATDVLTNYYEQEVKRIYVKVEDVCENMSDVVSYEVPSDFSYDNTLDNNLRYIGKNPNNYVDFNGEKWRIIGVMNNIDNGARKESRIKLIKEDSIGKLPSDTSASNISCGFGINEWSQTKLKSLLNDNYYNSTSKSLSCALNGDTGAASRTCTFNGNGLKALARELVDEVKWNTGANEIPIVDNDNSTYGIIASKFYELERSSNTGKRCTVPFASCACNDTVARTTTWVGRIGLMYPSDFGLAIGASTGLDRNACLSQAIDTVAENNAKNSCMENNWLNRGINEWTMTPASKNNSDNMMFAILDSAYVRRSIQYYQLDVRPVLYLKINTHILSGDGSKNNSFQLGLV